MRAVLTRPRSRASDVALNVFTATVVVMGLASFVLGEDFFLIAGVFVAAIFGLVAYFAVTSSEQG